MANELRGGNVDCTLGGLSICLDAAPIQSETLQRRPPGPFANVKLTVTHNDGASYTLAGATVIGGVIGTAEQGGTDG